MSRPKMPKKNAIKKLRKKFYDRQEKIRSRNREITHAALYALATSTLHGRPHSLICIDTKEATQYVKEIHRLAKILSINVTTRADAGKDPYPEVELTINVGRT